VSAKGALLELRQDHPFSGSANLAYQQVRVAAERLTEAQESALIARQAAAAAAADPPAGTNGDGTAMAVTLDLEALLADVKAEAARTDADTAAQQVSLLQA
jgi:hypothetical protein